MATTTQPAARWPAPRGVPWYIVSNATEHMTGDMFLLTDFTSPWPGRPGKGFLWSASLTVPDVSYVPGLTENIISLNQLIDSGFNVIFEPNGCSVVRSYDAQHQQRVVGRASHSSSQLYRINYLKIASS
uniref:Uncharacterized protein n=1 Tax=Oryza punctata TaxID=4537 RepID=A0A0E0MNL1_ORYPU